MIVSWNGEDIYHCDDVVEKTMNTYKGNFIRRSGRENTYLVSKAVDSKVKKPQRLQIMTKEEKNLVCLSAEICKKRK